MNPRNLTKALLICLLAASCGKEEALPEISIDGNLTAMPCNGGTVKVPVTCNCLWTAACDSAYVMIAPSSYEGSCNVSVTVPPTSAKVTDTVRINFTAVSAGQTVSAQYLVTLEPRPFIASPQTASTVYVSAEACTVTVEIESNDEWEYVYSSANKTLTLAPESGTGSQEVRVDFPAAAVTRNKTFNLTFRLKSDNTQKVTIKFIQYGKQ